MTGPAPAVIDLGRDRDEPELSRPWRQTTLGAVPVRSWLAALLVVVLLSPLAGSAGPVTGLVRLWSQSGVAGFELDAERLYSVVDHELTAYQLDDGAVGWTAAVPAAAQSDAYTVHRAGELVLVRGDTPDIASVAAVAYDAATGQPRWELVGDWGWPWLQEDLIVFTRDTTDASAGSSGREAEIAVADAASGAAPWVGRLGVGELLHVAPAADGPQAVAWSDDVMRRVDLVTGAELARTDVHYRPNAWWFTAAGTLIVGDRRGMTAFDLETLETRWSAQPESVDDEATRYVTARGGHPCEPWVCVADSAGAIRVLDPTTGQSRWEKRCAEGPDDCFLVLLPFGDGLAWMETYRLPGAATGLPQVTVSLLDQATGEEVARLGAWQTLYATGGPSRLVRLADGVIAGIGYQSEDELTQRDILGWLGREGQVRVLGEVEASWLATNGTHVVAATSEWIDVLRVRPPGGG